MKDMSTVYADITKVEKDPINPAFRLVHARISDETKDLDGQRADYDWLKTALPDWFKWGNVRDMHENNVVGKGKVLTDVPAQRGFDGVLKIVDPVAVVKLDEELFTGVSIGIKGPRVLNEKGAMVHPSQPGWIKGGKIVEVSLVDHPCNENCKLTVGKAAESGLVMITKGAKLETLVPENILEDGALYWYKRAKWNAAARREASQSGHAMAGGRFPIDDSSDVSDAVHLYNTGHGQTPDVRAHIVARAKALGQGNPFKKKNQTKLAAREITPEDLESYKKRFDPAFASQSVSLSDGSYLIMDEGDLFLAKGLRATGFGNVVAADVLIKRREAELTKKSADPNCPTCHGKDPDCPDCVMGKAAGATQQSTPRQPDKPDAPGARVNRDNPAKNAPPTAKPSNAKNPDKETVAHESVDASGSKDAYQDADGGASPDATHPPTKPKKGDKTKKPKKLAGPATDQIGEPPAHTHSVDTGSVGTRTNTAKVAEALTKIIKRKKDGTLKAVDPAQMSDKKLAKAYKILVKAGYATPQDAEKAATSSASDSFGSNSGRTFADFQRGGAGSPGGGRALLEQLVRNMQGRVIDYSQGPQAPDVGRGGSGGPDAPEEAGETTGNELLNDRNADLVGMRDGDPRINANTPASALGQSGPMNGADAVVSPPQGNDPGSPNTSLPFATAPQAGADRGAVFPGALPDSLAAPGDVRYVSREGAAPGSGGMGVASPPLRAATPAAQAGPVMYPSPIVGDSKRGGAPNSAFVNPQQRGTAPGTASGTGAALPGMTVVRGGVGNTRSAVTNTARAKGAKADKKKGKKKNKSAKMIDKLAKSAVADRVGTAVPDSIKAAVASALKKFTKSLERDVLTKYATADQLKAIQADIDRLGSLAMPGGPFVGKSVALDKDFAANQFAQPETTVVGIDVMEQMERYERMSKSTDRRLAASASSELKKLLDTHFPPEVAAEVTRRKRSATKQ